MNTKVKIGIVAGFVAAVIGLIVWDQRSAGTRETPPAAEVPVISETPPSDKQGLRLVPMDPPDVVGRATDTLETITTPTVRTVPETTPIVTLDPLPPAPAETYVVQQGDKLFTIAEKKYGDGNKYTLILQANPGLKPDTLRVGQKLVIPAKAAPAPAAIEAPVDSGDGRTYTVQSGDTLEKIAKRFYTSAKPSIMRQILEANASLGNGGDLLHVGMKLAMPKIDLNPAAPRVESADPACAAADAGRKTYKVVANDSLWKIAAKFKGGKNVTDMMDAIVAANGDKLHAKGDALQVGWTIVIPD